MARAAQAIIDLSAIEYNFTLAKSQAENAKAMAIIKADAYGHGAVPVAKKLASCVDAFGVACIEEAMELRAAGVSNSILLLEGFFSADELPVIAENNFWTALHSTYQLEWIQNAELSQPINIWLKMDSGMHRLGFDSQDFIEAYHQLKEMENVAEIVLMSHMACADDLDNDMSAAQIALFDQVSTGLSAEHSLANSPSILSNPASYRQWLRVGLMMYGASPFEVAHPIADKLKPAMSFTTKIIALREVSNSEAVGYAASYVCETPKVIATIAIGYADGYDRHIVNGSPVIVAGQLAKIAGRISMDMVTVDVTGLSDVKIGSNVELWGDALAVNEVAKAASTIPYTLFTGVTKRVPRVYLNSDVPES